MRKPKGEIHDVDGIGPGSEPPCEIPRVPFIPPRTVLAHVGGGEVPVPGREVQVLETDPPPVQAGARDEEIYRDYPLRVGSTGEHDFVPDR